MCTSCGCGKPGEALIEHEHADGTRHVHAHGEAHDHHHQHPPEALEIAARDSETIRLETDILAKNELIAQRNRERLTEHGVLALNLLSSPGAGKTSLLVRMLKDLAGELPIAVVEGDQATSHDADRIRAAGARAIQINTGTGCHLEADMLERALTILEPAPASVLLIENVGNLVCPALFDLGEEAKVVIFSVTEGEDKPLKYPHMFQAATVVLLSKTDLLPHLDFDVALALDNALRVNPALHIFQVSSKTGDGLEAWYDWVRTARSSPGVTPEILGQRKQSNVTIG